MGILLILAAAVVGYCLLKQFWNCDRPLVSLFGGFTVGFVVSGTTLYLIDLIFVKFLGDYSNGTILFLVLACVYTYYSNKQLAVLVRFRSDLIAIKSDLPALCLIGLLLVFCAWLNWHSLHTTHNGDILVANGAWSDLMYHVSYVRSVALGQNVPIQYPYFANEPIRYHFLFDYFTGKVAQLGFDSVHALNLISTVSLLSLLMLVFEFGRVVFKNVLSGALGLVFLLFHSSLSVFPWLKENLGRDLLQKLFEKEGWLTGTEFEVWGLFNLNVFVNQRHFALGLAVLVLLVIALVRFTEVANQSNQPLTSWTLPDLKQSMRDFEKLKFPLLWAVLIACVPFWNALFAVIAVAFIVGFALINYRNKLVLFSLVLAAALASIAIYPQLMLFKSGASALADYPRLHFGYGAENSSPFGFVAFYLKVFGVKLLLVAGASLLVSRKLRLYALVFLIPFAIANLFQLSSVLYDNNKLIFASLVFLNCYAAYAVSWFIRKRSRLMIALSVALIFMMTAAGLVDFFVVKNLKNAQLADQTSSLKWWTIKNTRPRSVFLTNVFIPFADNAVSSVTLAGRYLYVVSNCVSSSCVVEPRIENARKIYSLAGGVEQVKALAKSERIDYILVDEHVRNNQQLQLNERALIENFPVAYKDTSVTVFDVR